MSRVPTEQLIASLAATASPVRPLAPPLWRGLGALTLFATAGAVLILLFGDPPGLALRYSGREPLMMLEMGAMLLTGTLAVLGAFFVSIPGRSRRWLVAPLPSFAVWIGLSGLGCYQDFVRTGIGGWAPGHSVDCLTFLLGAGVLFGLPLLWRLSRASPVDPLPVASLGGLGAAALAAFLLQFFHPFALTAIDLAVHILAVLLIVMATALSRRRALAPG